jgi:hypothetical protein
MSKAEPVVVIEDETKIPAVYKIVTFTPNLPAIKQALECGVSVPGARLETEEESRGV